MSRNYIGGDQVRITRHEPFFVDLEYYGGRHVAELEPRRLFPVSGLTRYITLLDKDGKEEAIIRDLETLMPDSRQAVEQCLDEYYLIPKISAVLDCTEKFGILKWKVNTDRGIRSFEIRNRHSDIKVLYDGRVLIRDSDDNRYEIPDHRTLDNGSLKLLREYL